MTEFRIISLTIEGVTEDKKMSIKIEVKNFKNIFKKSSLNTKPTCLKTLNYVKTFQVNVGKHRKIKYYEKYFY